MSKAGSADMHALADAAVNAANERAAAKTAPIQAENRELIAMMKAIHGFEKALRAEFAKLNLVPNSLSAFCAPMRARRCQRAGWLQG